MRRAASLVSGREAGGRSPEIQLSTRAGRLSRQWKTIQTVDAGVETDRGRCVPVSAITSHGDRYACSAL